MSTTRINELTKQEKAIKEANKEFKIEFVSDNLKALCKLMDHKKEKKLKHYEPILPTIAEESRKMKP
jgi:hypothetical protein